jgi:hypothetical protein
VPPPGRFADDPARQDGETTVRYVAYILQLIVFYAAGAALFFAVTNVR